MTATVQAHTIRLLTLSRYGFAEFDKIESDEMSRTVEQATLTAPNISCGHCVATVRNAVGALAGVSQVEADADTKKVDIAFDPSRVTLAQIEAAMSEAGYPVQK